MSSPHPPGVDQDTPVFVISVAAQLAGLHAQLDGEGQVDDHLHLGRQVAQAAVEEAIGAQVLDAVDAVFLDRAGRDL